MEITEYCREKAKKRFLREIDPGLFVKVCQDNHHNGQDFRKVVYLGRDCVTVVFDHENNESCQRVHWLECIDMIANVDEFGIDCHTSFHANSIEKRGNLFAFKDTLRSELGDPSNKCFL